MLYCCKWGCCKNEVNSQGVRPPHGEGPPSPGGQNTLAAWRGRWHLVASPGLGEGVRAHARWVHQRMSYKCSVPRCASCWGGRGGPDQWPLPPQALFPEPRERSALHPLQVKHKWVSLITLLTLSFNNDGLQQQTTLCEAAQQKSTSGIVADPGGPSQCRWLGQGGGSRRSRPHTHQGPWVGEAEG